MFGLEFVLIAGLDMLGRLISIPSNSLALIEKIRINIVAAATALWLLIKKLSDVFLIESRAITLTVKLEREFTHPDEAPTTPPPPHQGSESLQSAPA
jgi:hypothetical protein